jgi:hypothetical protein
MNMWIVYDWSEGLCGIFETKEEAEKEYEALKESNRTQCDEFYGEEEVILAKVEKRFYGYDTKKPVWVEDEHGNEIESADTYWGWKEDVHTQFGVVKP